MGGKVVSDKELNKICAKLQKVGTTLPSSP